METILPVKFESVGLEDYQPFNCIERTIHFDDFTNDNDYLFNTSQISKRDNSFLSKYTKVLWFKPSTPDNENHFYGNVSFCISINKLFQHFCLNLGYKLYWVETVIWERTYDSRIILTKKDLINSEDAWDDSFDNEVFSKRKDIVQTMSFPLNEVGYPIYQDETGRFYQLSKMDEARYNHRKHEVEFLIEVSGEDGLWLRENCDCRPVDHSKANLKLKSGKYAPRNCHKYNCWLKQDCQSPYTMRETGQIMRDIDLRKLFLRNNRCNSIDHWPQHISRENKENCPRNRFALVDHQSQYFPRYNKENDQRCIPEHGMKQITNYSFPESAYLRLISHNRMGNKSGFDHNNNYVRSHYNYHNNGTYQNQPLRPLMNKALNGTRPHLALQLHNYIYNGGRYPYRHHRQYQ